MARPGIDPDRLSFTIALNTARDQVIRATNTLTNTTVDLSELLEFARTRHHHILVTYRRDGSPQLSPVTCGVDQEGRIVVSTYPQRAKVTNLRRNPAATLLVHSDDWDGPWVQLDGTAEVIDQPDAVEPLVDYFRSISGEHPGLRLVIDHEGTKRHEASALSRGIWSTTSVPRPGTPRISIWGAPL